VCPAVARDGTIIYDAIAAAAGGAIESHLEQRDPDGAIHVLTSGPADATPALATRSRGCWRIGSVRSRG